MPQKLKFISDQDLHAACVNVLDAIKKAHDSVTLNPDKNVIDPFSALFEAFFNDISLEEWMQAEIKRQVQKSWQNSIGIFHQQIIGSIDGFEDLGLGGILDIRGDKTKIFAEIKNKHNTTKGNHKVAVYDDILNLISQNNYQDYTGYYVEILTKKRVDRPFTPSDNKVKDKGQKRRPINKKIRQIDGKSFYALVTGEADAIEQLYKVLPQTIAEIMRSDASKIHQDPLYSVLFQKAFK